MKSAERSELHELLMEVRSAVIKLAANEPGTDSEIAEYVDELVDLFRIVEDRESIRYWQQHLRGEYAAEIRYALDAAESREDFTRRIAAAAADQDFVDQFRALISSAF